MMKTSKIFTIIALVCVMALTSLTLIGCKKGGQTQNLTDEALKATTTYDFSEGKLNAFKASDGYGNGDPFNVTWKADNVVYDNAEMKLSMTEVDGTYYSGELSTHQYFGYGDFEVSMKPVKKVGTASTFFTYTGDWDHRNAEGKGDKHDEIDIEFLGKDTTKVQFNFFVGGVGGNEYMYDLGFDASLEYHTYGFRWAKDYIVWFVDGKPVYKVTGEKKELPSMPGRIIMNYWAGSETAEGWMGKYAGPDAGEGATYQWVKTNVTPSGDEPGAPTSTDPGASTDPGSSADPSTPAEDAIDWSKVEASALTLWGGDAYTRTPADGAVEEVTVTYENVGGQSYANVGSRVGDIANENSCFNFTVKNNGTEAVKVRFDVQGTVRVGNTDILNTKAFATGHSEVYTDTNWGGSFITVQAGEEIDLTVEYDTTTDKGVATNIMFYFDSATDNSDPHSGNVTLSKFKFAGKAGSEGGQGEGGQGEGGQGEGGQGGDLVIPEDGDHTLTIGDFELEIGGNISDGYNVAANDEAGSLTVGYKDLAGACYKNIWADVSEIVDEANVFSIKVTNNGNKAVVFRTDIESNTDKGNTTACNLSATMDGAAIATDLEWGGSTATIAAGATVTIEIKFDNAAGVTKIKFFFDSSVYQDEAIHSGSVTISEFMFKKVA